MTPDIATFAALAFKLFTLLGIVVYIIFAAVMVRQEKLMSDVLEEGFEPFLKLLTWFHLFISIGLFVVALIIL